MVARLRARLCMISATMILLAGCAMTSQQDGNGLNGNSSFMDAWDTYSHCLTSKEPEAIVSDLHALNQFADTFSTNNPHEPSASLLIRFHLCHRSLQSTRPRW
jgi:hypothetical protein